MMNLVATSVVHQVVMAATMVAMTILSSATTNALRSHPNAYSRLLLTQQQQQQNRPCRNERQKRSCLNLRGGGDDDVIGIVSPHLEEPEIWSSKRKVVICMDTFSDYHGMYLAHQAKTVWGAGIVLVFSNYMKGYFQRQDPEQYEELSTMFLPANEEQIHDWYKSLTNDNQIDEVAGIVCESDSGLADAEKFGTLLPRFDNRHNGINEARRNKYLMINEVGKANLPVVQQKLCETIEETRAFSNEIMGLNDKNTPNNGRRVVVKPIRGVASDDVFLCSDMESVEKAFYHIHGTPIFSEPWDNHKSVLVQECAEGQEFAIDIISKNGEHKIAAIWKYDKRPANGRSVVYFATHIYDGEFAPIVCEYAKKCLNILGINWGISHNEVIMTEDGPRLVEVNCRQHNMDFIPLTMGSIGYNALDMLLSAYLGGEDPSFYPLDLNNRRLEWDALPDIPVKRMNGCMVHLVNYKEGKLLSINEEALMEIQHMDSVIDLQVYQHFLEIGSDITPTLDIRSDAGWVQMLNPNDEVFDKDYQRIIELMPELFEVDE